jgi:hypothetical protein
VVVMPALAVAVAERFAVVGAVADVRPAVR